MHKLKDYVGIMYAHAHIFKDTYLANYFLLPCIVCLFVSGKLT